jgi:hypothetical protein
MKGTMISKGLFGLVAVVLLAGTAFAQGPVTLQGKIPFDFIVGNVTLPTGDYWFQPRSSELLYIRSAKGEKTILVMTVPKVKKAPPRGAAESGKIVFHQYGNVYFLSNVINPFVHYDQSLTTTKEEKELMVKDNKAPKTVMIAANVERDR